MFDYEYDQVVEEYEQQIEQLENENAKMKSAIYVQGMSFFR